MAVLLSVAGYDIDLVERSGTVLTARSLSDWLAAAALACFFLFFVGHGNGNWMLMKLEPYSSSYQPYNNDESSCWKEFTGGRNQHVEEAACLSTAMPWQEILASSDFEIWEKLCSSSVSKWHRCAQARCAQFGGVGGPLNLNLATLSLQFHNFTEKASKNSPKQKPKMALQLHKRRRWTWVEGGGH